MTLNMALFIDLQVCDIELQLGACLG